MATAPFDTLITVINAVNTRLNGDVNTLQAIGGQILKYSHSYSHQLVNSGWRKLQEYLVSKGCVLLQSPPTIISGFGIVTPATPGVQPYVSWSEYFDGTSHNTSPVLPQDLIEPIEVQERPASSGNFNKMDLILASIPAVAHTAWNGSWQWRENRLVLAGATAPFDLFISYASYFPDFLDTGNTTTGVGVVPWYSQPIPIMRAFDALTNYICAEVERARENAPAVLGYTADAENSAMMIIDKDFSRDKSVMRAVEYGKMKDPYTPGGSPLTNSPGAGA